MKHRSMSSTALGNWTGYLRLRPVRCLQIEHNEIGEISAMFVFTAEDEEFVALVQGSRVPYSRKSVTVPNRSWRVERHPF